MFKHRERFVSCSPSLSTSLRSFGVGSMPNHRMQATAGGAAVLNSRVGRSPAAPDAER
jgi:hypothetical protein